MLTNRVAIYVPKGKWTHIAKMTFAKLFGGCTTTEAKGAWLTNKLVEDDITIVYSYTNDTKLHEVHKLAEKIRQNMNQEAVAVEVNGTMEFVKEKQQAA